MRRRWTSCGHRPARSPAARPLSCDRTAS
jgi:hypothetical protein